MAKKILTGLSGLFLAAAIMSSSAMAQNLPVILDVDTGRDDAWAILGAIDEMKVAGIVSTYGNVPLNLTTKNSLDVVYLGQHSLHDIKTPVDTIRVWSGEAKPLDPPSPAGVAEIARRAGINGNGLANVVLPQSSEVAANETDNWPKEFSQVIRQANKVDYIVCGPLTNLARLIDEFAVEKKGDIRSYIGKVVVMGGSFDPVLAVDFNFKADPAAAQKVIATFGKNVILVPFDETRKLKLTEAEIESLRPQDDAAAFSKELMLAHSRGWSSDHTILLHDPATLMALNEKTETRIEKISILQTGPDAGKVISNSKGVEVSRMVIEPGQEQILRDTLLHKYLNLDFSPK